MICKERVFNIIKDNQGLICKEYSEKLKARPGDVREALKSLHYFGRITMSIDRKSHTNKWYTKDHGPNSLNSKIVRQIWNGNIIL
tara:strand:+ start:419 stop:673 length:255 start_codon:yes stop_codon:yes gene_type:complete